MRGGRRWSLARQVNHQLTEECDLPSPSSSLQLSTKKQQFDPLLSLATRVSAKLEEGDFRGAVRLACSEDSVAEANKSTIAALRSKHPTPHPDSSMPPHPDSHELEGALVVSEGALVHAIRSFPNGSAGGPDGLRPQHSLDLTSASGGMGGQHLLRTLTAFANLLLDGDMPLDICSVVFGASLTALNKKGGGVRPIAVGCTLRRLIAKTASTAVMKRLGSLLAPLQLGYGTPLGAEAAAHSAGLYLADLPPDNVFKLNFKNAFNSVRRQNS